TLPTVPPPLGPGRVGRWGRGVGPAVIGQPSMPRPPLALDPLRRFKPRDSSPSKLGRKSCRTPARRGPLQTAARRGGGGRGRRQTPPDSTQDDSRWPIGSCPITPSPSISRVPSLGGAIARV